MREFWSEIDSICSLNQIICKWMPWKDCEPLWIRDAELNSKKTKVSRQVVGSFSLRHVSFAFDDHISIYLPFKKLDFYMAKKKQK